MSNQNRKQVGLHNTSDALAPGYT